MGRAGLPVDGRGPTDTRRRRHCDIWIEEPVRDDLAHLAGLGDLLHLPALPDDRSGIRHPQDGHGVLRDRGAPLPRRRAHDDPAARLHPHLLHPGLPGGPAPRTSTGLGGALPHPPVPRPARRARRRHDRHTDALGRLTCCAGPLHPDAFPAGRPGRLQHDGCLGDPRLRHHHRRRHPPGGAYQPTPGGLPGRHLGHRRPGGPVDRLHLPHVPGPNLTANGSRGRQRWHGARRDRTALLRSPRRDTHRRHRARRLPQDGHRPHRRLRRDVRDDVPARLVGTRMGGGLLDRLDPHRQCRTRRHHHLGCSGAHVRLSTGHQHDHPRPAHPVAGA